MLRSFGQNQFYLKYYYLSIIPTTLTYFEIILFNSSLNSTLKKNHLTAHEEQWEMREYLRMWSILFSFELTHSRVPVQKQKKCTNFNITHLASPGCELPECQVWEAVGPEEVSGAILLVSLPRLLCLLPLGGLEPIILLSLLRTQASILTKNYWKTAFILWLIHLNGLEVDPD